DNVVTQVIAFEGNGKLCEYIGGYEDWIRAKQFEDNSNQQKTVSKQPETSPTSSSTAAKPARTKKLSYQEARELEALPGKIDMLEREQAKITLRLNEPTIYRDHPDEVKALQTRLAAIEKELTDCLAKWEELESKSTAKM
ncbi:MAG: ABC transporter ATP-binding protein, partial [Nitrosomonas sp.]|nr:ABC transporter ATP-binding protein [Nitrosomonas sp.]